MPEQPKPDLSFEPYALSAEQEIRARALDAAIALTAECFVDATTWRDAAQSVIGIADRFVDWIRDGTEPSGP